MLWGILGTILELALEEEPRGLGSLLVELLRRWLRRMAMHRDGIVGEEGHVEGFDHVMSRFQLLAVLGLEMVMRR